MNEVIRVAIYLFFSMLRGPMNRVKMSQLKFEIDRMGLNGGAYSLPIPPKRNWLHRLAARYISCMILNQEADTYQFGGTEGANYSQYRMINAGKEQLVHWILIEAGYSCCTADIMRLTGRSSIVV